MSFRIIKRISAGILPALLLAGCASTPRIGGDPGLQVLDLKELPAPEPSDTAGPVQTYSVGPFDRLIVDVFGVEELSQKEIQVDGNGRISFPLVGLIQVGGKSTLEIEAMLTERLAQEYIRNPQVTVGLKEVQSQVLTVEGEVTKPGIYPVLGTMTLLRAMSLSGGLSDTASLDGVVVFRTVKSQRYAAMYDLKAIRRGEVQDPALYANDVVVVGDSPRRRFLKDALTMMPLITTPVILLDNLTN